MENNVTIHFEHNNEVSDSIFVNDIPLFTPETKAVMIAMVPKVRDSLLRFDNEAFSIHELPQIIESVNFKGNSLLEDIIFRVVCGMVLVDVAETFQLDLVAAIMSEKNSERMTEAMERIIFEMSGICLTQKPQNASHFQTVLALLLIGALIIVWRRIENNPSLVAEALIRTKLKSFRDLLGPS